MERAAAVAAGLVNGLLGGGGGMVLASCLLSRQEPGRALATSLAVMVPLSAVSGLVLLGSAVPAWGTLLPVVAGGLVGGYLGGRWLGRVPVQVLRTGFSLLLLYAGGRYLLG